jgi:hypothetical protein
MSEETDPPSTIRHDFVDEAGDPTLYSRHGKAIIGVEGCSKYFILGKLSIADPVRLGRELTELRHSLLTDPYFRGVPSMQPEKGKTARMFHAKDDLSEVRREVFQLLSRHAVEFFAVVRDKSVIADIVRGHRAKKPAYRYHPNQLYDRCVSQLFKERLHRDAGYVITFATRGTSDRTEALQRALDGARAAFREKWGVAATSPIEIVPSTPAKTACLQAVDYYLWALQRFYERNEDRFLTVLWPQTKLVLDVDDTRDKPYGVFYTQSNPLTIASRAKK